MTNDLPTESTLILGRPFLLTAETIINMKKGLITMGIGDQEVQFNLSEAMNHGYEDCSYLGISSIECHDNDLDHLHETDMHEPHWGDTVMKHDDIFTCLSSSHPSHFYAVKVAYHLALIMILLLILHLITLRKVHFLIL